MGGQRLGLGRPQPSTFPLRGTPNGVIHNLMHRLWISLYHRMRANYHFQWYICENCVVMSSLERSEWWRSDSRLRPSNHQLVDALEIFECGELDDHFSALRCQVDLYPGIEMTGKQLLEFEDSRRR